MTHLSCILIPASTIILCSQGLFISMLFPVLPWSCRTWYFWWSTRVYESATDSVLKRLQLLEMIFRFPNFCSWVYLVKFLMGCKSWILKCIVGRTLYHITMACPDDSLVMYSHTSFYYHPLLTGAIYLHVVPSTTLKLQNLIFLMINKGLWIRDRLGS